VWNEIVRDNLHSTLETKECLELLGGLGRESGTITEKVNRDLSFFSNLRVIEVKGHRELSVPVQGPKEGGVFVATVIRTGGKWKMTSSKLETKTAIADIYDA